MIYANYEQRLPTQQQQQQATSCPQATAATLATGNYQQQQLLQLQERAFSKQFSEFAFRLHVWETLSNSYRKTETHTHTHIHTHR